jgi:putative addiction module component (TIGR02574 family)
MESNPEAIYQAALELPEDERLALVTRILETVPDEPAGLSIDDPQLMAELERRSADLDGAVPWTQLRDEL